MAELAPMQKPARTFCTFRAQGRLYGIDVEQVREVSTHVTVTPVPQSPPIVRGLANLRSRVYLVLDVGPALGLPQSECTETSRLIVLQAHVAENLGLFVDCGGDIARVPLEQIETSTGQTTEAAESSLDRPASPVIGVCKLDAELMMIIDPLRIIQTLEKAIS
jgi:purine-binding chemotaxis protein CheW